MSLPSLVLLETRAAQASSVVLRRQFGNAEN